MLMQYVYFYVSHFIFSPFFSAPTKCEENGSNKTSLELIKELWGSNRQGPPAPK